MPQKVRMVCLYQSESIDSSQKQSLEIIAKRTYEQSFGSAFTMVVIWIAIPKGQAFIAGKPSTATTITLNVPQGTTNQLRHEFMHHFSRAWMGEMNCNENELILSAMDQSVANEFTSKSLSRFNPKAKRLHMAKIMVKLFLSKLFKGHFHMSTNVK